MNEYDSNRIFDITKKINYQKTENLKEADCYVLNTCHIREKATEKVYHDVGRIKKKFRGKRKPIVVVAGCVAQAEGDILLKKDKYIDAVVGPQSYHRLNEIISKIDKESKKINLTDFKVIEKFDNLNIIKNSNSNVSSFLTIQEGCNKFCKFCVVPYTRGPEFSRSIDELINETLNLVKNGTREINLLGQNVNAYSHNGKRLSHLIEEISKIDKIKRIRYTTSHPIDFSEDLIEAHKKVTKLMPLIHLPVQSGSDKILKKMNRKHTVKDYLKIIDKIRKIKPDIAISSDFIVGFPDESDNDFDETMKFIEKVKFVIAYSFIYSPRPGTPAQYKDNIDHGLKKARLSALQSLLTEQQKKYNKSFINKDMEVLFEKKGRHEDQYIGRTIYNQSVFTTSKEKILNKILKVKIKNSTNFALECQI